MIPYHYQEELAAEGFEILREHMIVYLAMEERTGKTLTSLLIAEMCDIESVLIITKKKALGTKEQPGWIQALESASNLLTKDYKVINYHQARKEVDCYDLIILDESHNYISAFPKVGKMWKEIAKLTKGKPLMYLSATPHAQGPQMLYHQFKLSSWTPWNLYSNFYSWFVTYGKPYSIEINGIKINQYDKCDVDYVLATVEHLFITKTRKELGFEFEPEDRIHYVGLDKKTKDIYNELVEHNIINLDCGSTLVCDTKPKLRASLHMLEGGVAKIEETRLVLANREKIDYILQHFGDSEDLVIMYNFISEQEKLNDVFKKATILQATSFAEGIDLHKFNTLVIYSQDYSTARHTQRRARQANKQREKPIVVHYLLVKKGISEQVYKTVSVNKKNYVDSRFNKEYL